MTDIDLTQDASHPRTPPEAQQSNKKKKLLIGIGIAMLCLCCALVATGGGGVAYYQYTVNITNTAVAATNTQQAFYDFATATKQEHYARVTATKQEAIARITATKQEQIARATAVAEEALALVPQAASAEFAQLKMFETFDRIGDWNIGPENSEYWSGNQKVFSGKYVWDVEVPKKEYFYSWTSLPDITVMDFYFQVSIKRALGSISDSCYGIVFRETDAGYYKMEVCDDRQYYVDYRDTSKDKWVDIRDWTKSSLIRPGEVNELGVSARGEAIDLYINGELVFSFSDSRTSKSGELGLMVSFNEQKVKSSFEFDNVIVLIP